MERSVVKMSQFDQSSEPSSWQELTRQANRYYLLQDIEQARALYTHAMTKASELLDHFQEIGLPLSAPPIFVVSCHNLADLYFREEKPEQAAVFLHRACTELIRLAELPTLAIRARLACVEQLRPAIVALMEREGGALSQQQKTQMLVLHARTAALAVYRISGYAAQTSLENVPPIGTPS